MMFFSSKLLFLFMLVVSTLLSISAPNMLGAWLGLEVNLMSFIPLMINNQSAPTSESAMKYFFVQALSSLLLLTFVVFSLILSPMGGAGFSTWLSVVMMLILFIKLGAAPFYHWFPGVVSGVSWGSGFVLMTWQKFAPMILVGYFFTYNYLIGGVILLSAFVGALGGINQMSLRKLMAYSSINHMAWMVLGLMVGLNFMLVYYIIYSLTSAVLVCLMNSEGYFYISQVYYSSSVGSNHLLMFLSWLSFGGLPPFVGFFPKWVVISVAINSGLVFVVFFLVMMSLFSLFYYLRVSYTIFTQSGGLNFMVAMNSKLSMWLVSVGYLVMLSGLLIMPLGISWY